MLKEKEESQKMDPKPLKKLPKKNTYGRGWHGEDDGRGTLDEVNQTNSEAKPNEKGGLLKDLFVRQDHPAQTLFKKNELRIKRLGIPLE